MNKYHNNMSLDEILSRAYILIKNKIISAKSDKETFEAVSYSLSIINLLKDNLNDSEDSKSLLLFYNSMIMDLFYISNGSKEHKEKFISKINILNN